MHQENPIDSSPTTLHSCKVVYLQMILNLLIVCICHLRALFGHMNIISQQLCGSLEQDKNPYRMEHLTIIKELLVWRFYE
jgi:hypothetical protein